MVQVFKDFWHNLKDYINHIMKVSFGELIFHFFELLVLILIALFTYVPIYLLQDVGLNLLRVFSNGLSSTLLDVYNLVFSIIEILVAFFVFLYLFNKRYEDIKNAPINEKKQGANNKDKKKADKKEVDLPKMKDE